MRELFCDSCTTRESLHASTVAYTVLYKLTDTVCSKEAPSLNVVVAQNGLGRVRVFKPPSTRVSTVANVSAVR